jgi:hypothetical protein
VRKNCRKGLVAALLIALTALFSSCSAYRVVATVASDGTLSYGGEAYHPVLAQDGLLPVFLPGERLGRTEDGAWVKTVQDDAQAEYVCVVSGTGRRLFARQPAALSAGTAVTSVFFEYLGGNVLRYDTPEALKEVLALKSLQGGRYSFSYQELLSVPGKVLCEPVFVYFAYDNSPIAVEWFGEITKIDDTFLFVPRGERGARDAGDFKSETLCDGIVIADNDYITRLGLLTGVE